MRNSDSTTRSVSSCFSLLRTPRSTSCLGLSLPEILVFIAIVGIVAALAIPKLPLGESYHDPIAANELVMHLRYIQSLAMSRDRTTRVVFNVATDTYTVSIADTNEPASYIPLKDPTTQNDWITDISDKFPGVGLSAVSIGGSSTLYFSKTNGIPCDASGVPIAASGTIVFDSGLSIGITPDTGYVGM